MALSETTREEARQIIARYPKKRSALLPMLHLVSDGGTRPYRVHFRDPSFNNLQSAPAMSEGSMVADVIAAVASIDPVMGGVDR